ncbi:MAG: ROK family protein [Chloracidobacterium sp.]|nr:ROK family protein [Chloracidobacterium sp.]
MENRSNRVGIEVSSSHFLAVSIDEKDAIAKTFSSPVEKEEDRAAQLLGFVKKLKAEFGDFTSAGISFPGLVDREAQRVAFSAQIPEHSDIDLVGQMRSAAGIEAVIENDANAAAYGEFVLGAGRGSRNLFYITLGEGVGGAFILNGEIWRGAAGFAGEFGYVPIDSEGTKLEEVASTVNIIRRIRSRIHQDNTSSLNSLDEEAITLDAIITAALKEDDFAQMMLQRTGAYVGSAVASVINLLNIEKIVIGGEIMKAKHLVLDGIVQRSKELSFRPSFDSTKIVEGKLGENAAAAGAALLAHQAE